VLAGLAFPREESERVPAPRWRVPVGFALAAVFSGVVLFSMEGRTWDSHRPRLEALQAVPAQPLERAGYDAFSLARATPEEVAAAASVSPTDAARWIEAARLATLRGIGAENAALLRSVGIEDVEALAAADAEHLTTQLEAASGRDIVPARIRVWIRAARSEAAREARAIPSPRASDRRSSP
jgi:predicted flap endonuclease-1-like 5' DNA nuclease